MKDVKIPASNLPRLTQEIAVMNKRAAKLSLPPVKLEVMSRVMEKKTSHLGFTYDEEYAYVNLSGEEPRLNGWHYVGRIIGQQNGENLIYCLPGFTAPPEYRTAEIICEHCQVSRNRKEVMLLKHVSDKYCRVGRDCLRDFLGVNPELMLMKAGIGTLLTSATREEWSTRPDDQLVNTRRFMIVCAACIRCMGWVSRSKAGENEQATADVAWELCTLPSDETRGMVRTFEILVKEDDISLAEAALEWGKKVDADNADDYYQNLAVACRQDMVNAKTMGLLASAVVVYKREKLAKESSGGKKSVAVGTIGEKRGFPNLLIEEIRKVANSFGLSTLVRFRDDDGNLLVWWGNDSWVVQGSRVDITGTIKQHSTFAGDVQTTLGRVTLGLPVIKVKKSRKKSS
jgi:hypothetical protein